MSTPTDQEVAMMGANPIGRKQVSRTVAVPTSLTNGIPTSAQEVEFAWFAGGDVFVPTGSSITTLTFYKSDLPAANGKANWGPAYQPDPSNITNPPTMVAVTLTVTAGNWYPLPACLFGCGNFAMTGNAAGTVYVSLKG